MSDVVARRSSRDRRGRRRCRPGRLAWLTSRACRPTPQRARRRDRVAAPISAFVVPPSVAVAFVPPTASRPTAATTVGHLEASVLRWPARSRCRRPSTLVPPPMKACTSLAIDAGGVDPRDRDGAASTRRSPSPWRVCVEVASDSTVFPVVVMTVAVEPLRGPMNASTSESILAVASPPAPAIRATATARSVGVGRVGRRRGDACSEPALTLAPPPTQARVPIAVGAGRGDGCGREERADRRRRRPSRPGRRPSPSPCRSR